MIVHRFVGPVVFALMLSGASVTTGQEGTTASQRKLPEGWMIAPGVLEHDDLWTCASYGESRIVQLKQGEIVLSDEDYRHRNPPTALPPEIHRTKEMIGYPTILKTDRGSLVGFDGGEFGGGLWWFSRDGKQTRKISQENVHAIYRSGTGVYVLSGLAHMTFNGGELFSFNESAADVSIAKLADLGGSPEASLLLPDGRIAVATPTSVILVDRNGQVDKLYQGKTYSWDQRKKLNYTGNDQENLTYPTSIEMDNLGDMYVGTRFFVLRLVSDQGKYRSEWLMPTACRTFKLEKYICHCGDSK